MSRYQEIAKRQVERIDDDRASGRDIVRLPPWDDDQRGVPTAVVRSALFGLVKRGRRTFLEKETLVSWAGNQIQYTGYRLDQADLDCWLQVLHLARLYPLGRDVRFTARGFLRDIGRNGDGNTQRWLHGSMGRLQVCGVCIRTADAREYQGPLISDFFVDGKFGRYVVRVNPLLADIYDEAFVKLSLETRLALPQGLPRFLQLYVQSHQATEKNPHRIGLAVLKGMCGSERGQIRNFRVEVKKAMGHLERLGVVARWRITDGDALEFVRP